MSPSGLSADRTSATDRSPSYALRHCRFGREEPFDPRGNDLLSVWACHNSRATRISICPPIRLGLTGSVAIIVGSRPADPQSSSSPLKRTMQLAAQPTLRRKRSDSDIGIECGAGQPGLGHHDFQAPQLLGDRRQLTYAKDVRGGLAGFGTRLSPIGHEPTWFAYACTSDALVSQCPDEPCGSS
jgi:hypothetical protein